MARKIMATFVLSLTIMACSKEPQSISYYAEHEAERQEQLKKAGINPEKQRGNPDVINATTAAVNELNRKLLEKRPAAVK